MIFVPVYPFLQHHPGSVSLVPFCTRSTQLCSVGSELLSQAICPQRQTPTEAIVAAGTLPVPRASLSSLPSCPSSLPLEWPLVSSTWPLLSKQGGGGREVSRGMKLTVPKRGMSGWPSSLLISSGSVSVILLHKVCCNHSHCSWLGSSQGNGCGRGQCENLLLPS